MPTVFRLKDCRIVVYADDHNPPHFHVIGAGWSYVVEMESLSVIRGELNHRSFGEVFRWASSNRSYLFEKWAEYNERD